MNWLVIDAGNTAVKWARSLSKGNRFIGGGIEARAAGTSLTERLATVWRVPTASAAFGVSVADEATMLAIEAAAREAGAGGVQWFGSQRHFEGHGLAHAVALINGYQLPLQLGADRWHGMIAACAKYPDESLIVVSAGTATTIDCIRAEPLAAAVFIGGVIAPGFELMRQSLAFGTARLPLANAATIEPTAHARNTDEAIVSGVHYAQLGLIEGVARDFAAELDRAQKEAPRLLLTGGGARRLVAPLTRSLLAERAVTSIALENGLVLRGVALRAHNEAALSLATAAAAPQAESVDGGEAAV